RMHRAGVDRAGRRLLRRRRAAEIALRIGLESFAAARRAEVIGLSTMLGAVLRRGGIDRHAADRVDGRGHGLRMACLRVRPVAVPRVAMPSVAMPSVAMPSVAMPSVVAMAAAMLAGV